MIVKIPDYYEEFRCIAGDCKHSCCCSWEIDIDEDTYQYYRTVEGAFGDKLRENIKTGKRNFFKMKHGKCPFLRKDQLCEVFTQLGEEALCEVCTEYPRFVTDYGMIRERALCLSCEEVGRILFSKKDPVTIKEFVQPGDLDMEQTDRETKEQEKRNDIVRARDACIEMIQDRTLPLKERVVRVIKFAKEFQDTIDGNLIGNEAALTENFVDSNSLAYQKKRHALFMERMEVFLRMEVMEEEWQEEINNVARAFHGDLQEELYVTIEKNFLEDMKDRMQEYEQLLVYFLFRYVIQAIYDNNFYNRVKFCIVCYLVIRDMDYTRYLIHNNEYTLEDRIDTVRIFSKQTEHSEKCLNYLMDAMKEKETFSTLNLLLQI